MSSVSVSVEASPEAVFSVLANGWLYRHWVSGTRDILGVDGLWPGQGATFRHRVGAGLFTTSDTTSVLAYDPPRRLELRARAWPAGQAHVTLTVERSSDGRASRITLVEQPLTGPARLLSSWPLRELVSARNHASLRRLARLCEEAGVPGGQPREPSREGPAMPAFGRAGDAAAPRQGSEEGVGAEAGP